MLSPGTRLGPYEILSLIGAGGMGQVYKARDTRLLREVALKVLPAESASALNHPNVVTIYDVGREDALCYIAMELVDGQTLRETMREGPIAVDRLIDIGAQIADGLAAAHDKRIVHRDLKPENVM